MPATTTATEPRRAPPQVVVGTAGHVDHGKSTLVRQLTGTDPDRLAEEKQRGLSIELGFAFLPGAEHGHDLDLGFVDCPGHARFLRQTIAGMGAMQGCLLIVAADEGVAAQTREHLDLLRLLQIPWGRVVITKAGLVDAARLAVLTTELDELLSGSVFAAQPPLVTDALAGQGLDELRDWLFATGAEHLPSSAPTATPRLAADRVFTVPGHGTVATGTLLGSVLRVGDELAGHPGPRGRVRGLQVRSLPVDEALPGQRTAVNLAGVDHHALPRGSWLAPVDSLQGSERIDVLLRPIGTGVVHGQALQCHHGAAVVAGRVVLVDADRADGGQALAQLRLERPLYLGPGDDVICRRASPPATLGVATVLATGAPKHKRFRAATRRWFADLQGTPAQRLVSWLEQLGSEPATRTQAERFCGGATKLDAALAGASVGVVTRHLPRATVYWSAQAWERLAHRVAEAWREAAAAGGGAIWQPHDRLRLELAPGCPPAAWEDRLAAWTGEPLAGSGPLQRRDRLICLPEALPPLPSGLAAECAALVADYAAAGATAAYDHPVCDGRPDPELARRALATAAARGWLVPLSDRQHWHRELVAALLADLHRAFQADTVVDLAWAKERWQLTRRQLLPFLDWCDTQGLTQRHGQVRQPGGRLQGPALPVPLLGALPSSTAPALPPALADQS